jgi:hypothetical protein
LFIRGRSAASEEIRRRTLVWTHGTEKGTGEQGVFEEIIKRDPENGLVYQDSAEFGVC